MDLLHYSETGNGEPLIILHGLFGSGKNWQSLARVFSRHFKVYTLDLRNHGQSFHHHEMNYAVMAEDVYRLMQHLGIESCSLIGHSMGGKTAMLLTLKHPQLVSRLVVADIAPVVYSHAHHHLIDPIMALKLDQMDNRSAVDKALQRDIPDTTLRNFLLQNLERKHQQWRWKVNWSAIDRQLNHLTGFSNLPIEWKVRTPTQFIRGENSDYIGAAEESVIADHFEEATIRTITNAGHWLHAEQPEKFSQLVLSFLLR
jgi:pimeloyl-ACP methyl ester carboxylesterase